MTFKEIAIESEKMTLVSKGKQETVFYKDASLTDEYVSTLSINKIEQQQIEQI